VIVRAPNAKWLRLPNIFAVDADGRGIGRFMRIGARLAFWPLALLTLIAVALELGVYRTEIKIAGPFAQEAGPPYHSLILEIPKGSLATRWRQRPLGDDAQQPLRSVLELRIDGRTVGPPHGGHQAIRENTTSGFSHWENVVIFALPPDVRNGPETTVALSYPARPRRGLTFALALLTALLGGFLYRPRADFFARALTAVQGRIPRRLGRPSLRNIFAADADRRRIDRFMQIGARLVFWPLALLTLVALILEFGAFQTEIKIAGPFAPEAGPASRSLLLEVPQGGRATWWRQPPLGDNAQQPFRSILDLYINGRKVEPPHSQHQAIREGTTTGFSHWETSVIFSLPTEVKNGPETTVTMSYPARPRDGLTLVLAFILALLGRFLYKPLPSRYARALTAVPARIPSLILLGFCLFGLIGSAIYAAASLYALTEGWALPTTAPIRWSPIARWAALNEPYLGYLLLTLAGIGASVSWLVRPKAHHAKAIQSNEPLPKRFLALCLFAIAACAFILSGSAMWIGLSRPGDLNYSNIGGLIPFMDAAYYLGSAHDQVQGGFWNEVALRRPLAAAFRSVLLIFSNFSLPLMLVLQACLLAAATCFAVTAIVAWRGIWAGITFFALIYIYARYFVPTTLTEPLGLFWALLSIPFFIEAFRSRSAKPALMAFALTTVALMTRMGSMFTIPALLLWLVWQFGQGAASLRVLALACLIVLGIFGVNSLLKNAYGAEEGASNFSYQLCGLTIGTTWEGCLEKLASEGKPLEGQEGARANKLYAMAWDNFRAHPSVFFYRLASGAQAFVTRLPDLIWKGYYSTIPEPWWLWRKSLTAICLIGLFFAARRMTALELTFWALVWASIAASVSIIYFDDGARTLAASYPLIALFFAMAMGNPAGSVPRVSPAHLRLRYARLGLTVAGLLFVAVPWMAHRFISISETAASPLSQKPGEAFVLGGRRMIGFLIVADGQPLRSDIPSLHWTDFDAIVSRSNMEGYQNLIHPVAPPLPFGFVFAPRLEKGAESLALFIVPAEVLERSSVPSWRFQLMRWGDKLTARHGELWFYVTKAEPWPCISGFRQAIETGRCRN
jgi:hypothetical protein